MFEHEEWILQVFWLTISEEVSVICLAGAVNAILHTEPFGQEQPALVALRIADARVLIIMKIPRSSCVADVSSQATGVGQPVQLTDHQATARHAHHHAYDLEIHLRNDCRSFQPSIRCSAWAATCV